MLATTALRTLTSHLAAAAPLLQQAFATLAAARPARRPTCPWEQHQQRIPVLRRACERCLQSGMWRVARAVCPAWQHGQAARVHALLQDWHCRQSLPATRAGGVRARAGRAGEGGTWVLGGQSASTGKRGMRPGTKSTGKNPRERRQAYLPLQSSNLAPAHSCRAAKKTSSTEAGRSMHSAHSAPDCMPHFSSCGCCKMMTRPASRSGAVGSVAHKHTELGRLHRRKETAAAAMAMGAGASSAAVAAA